MLLCSVEPSHWPAESAVSQSPQSEPDRSWPSYCDLPFAVSGAPDEFSLQLLPQYLPEDIRQRLALEPLGEISCRPRRGACVVGIDQPLYESDTVRARDINGATPRNEQGREFIAASEKERLSGRR